MKKDYNVYKWYSYEEFIPQKNCFKRTTPVRHSRPMTQEEIKIKKISNFWSLFNFLGGITFFTIGIFAMMGLAVIGDAKHWIPFGWWCLGGCIISLSFLVFYLKIGQKQELTYDEKVDHFSDWGFEVFDLMLEGERERQSNLAKEWREKHRLEESIRIAQETQNCVDIAKVARIYAEQLKGE